MGWYLPQLCRYLTCWTELSSRGAALFLLSFTESSTHLKQKFKLEFLEHASVCWFIIFKSLSPSTRDWIESMDRNTGQAACQKKTIYRKAACQKKKDL